MYRTRLTEEMALIHCTVVLTKTLNSLLSFIDSCLDSIMIYEKFYYHSMLLSIIRKLNNFS